MKIGAHVSAAGGKQNCFKNAEKIGAQCLQIFGASPRQWQAKLPDKEEIKKYHEEQKRTGLGPVFLHAPYLINLATPEKELFKKSVKALTTHLEIANTLKAEGLIFHIGSYKNSTLKEAEKRVVKGMKQAMSSAPGPAKLIMENSSGGGKKMGNTLEELGRLFKAAKSARVKVCIDTCHAFAAGALHSFSPTEIKAFTHEADRAFGLKNLTVLHVNDSKAEFNSKKDRHENIGKGHLGLKAFKNLAKNPHFKSLPWLLEVPGFKGTGPDAKNIKILKSL